MEYNFSKILHHYSDLKETSGEKGEAGWLNVLHNEKLSRREKGRCILYL